MSREAAWQVIHRAAKRAGLRGCIGTHSLRKTFGTDIYLRSGRDIRITQEALHHATVEATIAYLPVAHELLRGLVMSDGVARLILADGPGLDGAT
jgi:integrase/recombinase XerD